MNNSITKKEIKNYSRDFRTIANRTLNSDFDVFDDNLKRLIYHIDNNPIISEFINSCTTDEDSFDIKNDIEQVSNGYGEYYFDSFIEDEKEVSYTYQILKYITENNINFRSYVYPYSTSNKYQDKVKGFNDKFILPFVNAIDGNFERICVEMGFDEESKYNITINGGQVNIAKDNSVLNATQNNNFELNDLISKLKDTLERNDIEEGIKNEIIDNAEGILEEANNEIPRKGRLKSFIEGLKESAKLVPGIIELGANITAIISFVQPLIQ
ncbi:MAG: hypothetical protein HFJ57_03090 [Clostridia bacterium]|nr:hypothetical protein [Clostridia bacterium]